jgi:hypothetical protein
VVLTKQIVKLEEETSKIATNVENMEEEAKELKKTNRLK